MLDLNINEIKRPNGAIGFQGVDAENIRSILKNVAKLPIPENASMREMVDIFKQNPEAQNKVRSLMLKQPLEGFELPDGTISIKDGHHRAFLLNQVGDKTLPASIKDYTGPSKPKAVGKAGIAAALAGGAGAASAGDLRRAAGDVAESFLPLGVTPSTLAPGTLTPEQRAASDAATQRKRQQEEAAKMKAQALLRTGVPMPDEYRQGGRVRMI
jgi:hypothetical protein